MPGFISDTPLARELIRIGDEAIAREDDAALRAYFAEDYVFHGPGGDLGFDQLSAYFTSLRAAFSDLRLESAGPWAARVSQSAAVQPQRQGRDESSTWPIWLRLSLI
jgi:hypothetical protein